MVVIVKMTVIVFKNSAFFGLREDRRALISMIVFGRKSSGMKEKLFVCMPSLNRRETSRIRTYDAAQILSCLYFTLSIDGQRRVCQIHHTIIFTIGSVMRC